MKSVYTGGEKVAEFESYDELRVGDGKPAFIYEGNELVYPNPVKDGLVLWYDFSGRTNTDGQRGIAEDLSGNGNHGTLQNFNFTPEYGYDGNKLKFDGVDDYVALPKGITSGNKGFTFETVVEFDYFEEKLWANFMSLSNPHALMIRHSGGLGWYISYEEGKSYIIHSSFNLSDIPLGTPVYLAYVSEFIEEGSAQTTFIINEEFTQNSGDLPPNFNGFRPTELGSSSSNRKMEFKNKSAKFYNRPLTPEEVAHNYAIEKERFGIE